MIARSKSVTREGRSRKAVLVCGQCPPWPAVSRVALLACGGYIKSSQESSHRLANKAASRQVGPPGGQRTRGKTRITTETPWTRERHSRADPNAALLDQAFARLPPAHCSRAPLLTAGVCPALVVDSNAAKNVDSSRLLTSSMTRTALLVLAACATQGAGVRAHAHEGTRKQVRAPPPRVCDGRGVAC